MGITLDQLVFDTANPDDGANVGAHIRAGDDGTAIGHDSDSLKVSDSASQALLTTIDADTSLVAGAISGTEMQVDLVDAIGNWSTNAGAVDATTQRVHLSDESLSALENISVTVGAANGTYKTSAVTVTATAAEVVAVPHTNRTSILIQNLGSKDIYLGESAGVTSANGIKIPAKSSYEDTNIGPNVDLFLISASGSQDVRILEKSAS